jgi:hypothetical protein
MSSNGTLYEWHKAEDGSIVYKTKDHEFYFEISKDGSGYEVVAPMNVGCNMSTHVADMDRAESDLERNFEAIRSLATK